MKKGAGHRRALDGEDEANDSHAARKFFARVEAAPPANGGDREIGAREFHP